MAAGCVSSPLLTEPKTLKIQTTTLPAASKLVFTQSGPVPYFSHDLRLLASFQPPQKTPFGSLAKAGAALRGAGAAAEDVRPLAARGDCGLPKKKQAERGSQHKHTHMRLFFSPGKQSCAGN